MINVLKIYTRELPYTIQVYHKPTADLRKLSTAAVSYHRTRRNITTPLQILYQKLERNI